MPAAAMLATPVKERCYGCFRPRGDCFCATIPTIDNRTDVLILQHMRERFHPFNTARMVHRALRCSQLAVAHNQQLAESLPTLLKPRAGVLYPGPEATLLGELPEDQRPDQLLILDGTWHHAKTMMRDISLLQGLPHYRLAPAEPSCYRIRREPNPLALSTVEATIAALRVLEPDTPGLDRLLAAFVAMIDHQLGHPRSSDTLRKISKRRRTAKNIPSALLGDLNQIVAAYGESVPHASGDENAPRQPVHWVAQRLGTGESFSITIQPVGELPEALLRHMELSRAEFDHAVTLAAARQAWAAFLQPHETLAVYNHGAARLHEQLSPPGISCVMLKSVDIKSSTRHGSLDEMLQGQGLEPASIMAPGRAGKRLANLVAYVRYLNEHAERLSSDVR
jgi:DTW domain-containing protein YfiP